MSKKVDQTTSKSTPYKRAGVNIDEGNKFVSLIKPKIKETNIPGVLGSLSGFGSAFDLKKAGFKDPILISATDGVGTKLKIALETGKMETIGQDLVAMCTNDLMCEGARPLFFLDYYATGKLESNSAAIVLEGVIEGCKQAGCALIGGETAEMPGLYSGKDFDLAGFAVGALERGNQLPNSIKENDVIIGIPSSGFHSNGYSLVRKIVKEQGKSWESTSPTNPDQTLGDMLLEPTRIYQSLLEPLIERKYINGLCHVTGGGITENLPRILPENLSFIINLEAWKVPEIITWFINCSNMDQNESLRTFNCGIGMICVVARKHLNMVKSHFENLNEPIFEIGTIVGANKGSYIGTLSS